MNKTLQASLILFLCVLFIGIPAAAFAQDDSAAAESEEDQIVNFDDMDESDEDELVDFDDDEEEESPRSPAARIMDSIKFNLYIDLGLSAEYFPRRSSEKLGLTFDQDHHHFLVRAQFKDFLTVHLDLLNTFSQATLQIAPDNFIFFGNILIPFGNIDYHHLYGGRVEEEGTFLPTTWSNLGVGYRSLVAGRRGNFAVYLLNGFAAPAAFANFSSMDLEDHNHLKAIGLRYQHQITSGFSLTASVLADFPATDNNWNDHMFLYGLDTIVKVKAFTFSAGFTLHEVYLESLGENDRFLFPASYLRMGSYAEFRYDFSSRTALRMRVGHLDRNSGQETASDEINANLGVILNFGVIRLTGEYNLMMHVFPDAVYESENYQNSLKINVLIQL